MDNSFTKNCIVLQESCTTALDNADFASKIDLSFLDPPFNQDKTYNAWNDNLPPEEYWKWMRDICARKGTNSNRIVILCKRGNEMVGLVSQNKTKKLKRTADVFQNS